MTFPYVVLDCDGLNAVLFVKYEREDDVPRFANDVDAILKDAPDFDGYDEAHDYLLAELSQRGWKLTEWDGPVALTDLTHPDYNGQEE